MKKTINLEKGQSIFKNLEIEILNKHSSLKEFCDVIQLEYNEFYKKLIGVDDFELSEIILVVKYFNKSFDYLFEEEH